MSHSHHMLPFVMCLSTTLISVIPISATPTMDPQPSPSRNHTNDNSTDDHTHTDMDSLDGTQQLDLMIGIGLGVVLFVLSLYLVYRYGVRHSASHRTTSPVSASPASSSAYSAHIIDLEQPLLDAHNANDVPLQIQEHEQYQHLEQSHNIVQS